ncbi:hypothetical protein M569_15411, partial [Genlisea aurea]
DPLLLEYDDKDLRIASEFLSNWLPFLSRDLCQSCTQKLSHSIQSLHTDEIDSVPSTADVDCNGCDQDQGTCSVSCEDNVDNNDGRYEAEMETAPPATSETPKISWADMATDNVLFPEDETGSNPSCITAVESSPASGNDVKKKVVWTRDQREAFRFNAIERKKDFKCFEKVKGHYVNILEGLELHKGIFSGAEQKRIVKLVEELVELGKNNKLKERTYSAPQKWMRGKGRVTLQFGCCYNYAVDKKGNPPGILQDEMVDPLPDLFKTMIKRLVKWRVLPPSCVPDSCIVNIYEEGDCIPPHIDSHDFVRPFCTVSFLSECEILFGSNLKIVAPGEFSGSFAIPLPIGSVLVLNGNGADVAKHCVPAVPSQRYSRKTDLEKK